MCVSGGERLKRWPHEGPANAQAAILVKPKRPDRPSSRLEVLFHGEQKFPDQVASAANSQFIMVASQLDHGGRLQQALFGDWSKACEVVFAELASGDTCLGGCTPFARPCVAKRRKGAACTREASAASSTPRRSTRSEPSAGTTA